MMEFVLFCFADLVYCIAFLVVFALYDRTMRKSVRERKKRMCRESCLVLLHSFLLLLLACFWLSEYMPYLVSASFCLPLGTYKIASADREGDNSSDNKRSR